MIRILKSKKTIESRHCKTAIPLYPRKKTEAESYQGCGRIASEWWNRISVDWLWCLQFFAARPPLRAALARVRERASDPRLMVLSVLWAIHTALWDARGARVFSPSILETLVF